jgi:hypothetical protein
LKKFKISTFKNEKMFTVFRSYEQISVLVYVYILIHFILGEKRETYLIGV